LTLERLSGLDTHPISTLHLCPASAGHFSQPHCAAKPGETAWPLLKGHRHQANPDV
jgi:hypothetical protein